MTYEKTIARDAMPGGYGRCIAVMRVAEIALLVILIFGMIPMGSSNRVYAGTGDVQTWYDCLDKIAGKMETDNFWYSNSNNSRTYAGAKKNKRVSNCARYVSWALQDYGVISGKKVFWFKKGGAIGGDSTYIRNNKKLKIMHPNKSAAKCNLKPGDICGWDNMQHTAVYAGKNKKGQLLWYSAGRDGGTTSRGKTYFKANKVKAKCRADRYNGKISTVIRIKDFKDKNNKAKKNANKDKNKHEKKNQQKKNDSKDNKYKDAITIEITFDW